MTNFTHQLNERTFKGNVVLAITDNDSNVTYFSQFPVDSGLSVDYEGYIIDASINGENIELRDAKTSLASINFTLLDNDGDISTAISADANAWINYKVDFYYGFVTGSYGWANYKLISTAKISSFSKSANMYKFGAKVPLSLLNKRIYTTFNYLDGDITDSDTTISLVDASDFASSGTAYIDGEFVTWSGKSTNDLTGVTRAQLNSDADAHDDGQEVYVVTKLEDESMDIALEVIQNQVGVDSSQIDTTAFEALRDDDFDSDGDFIFYVWDIKSALTWLEENILLPTNTRLINKESKISIVRLDQVAFSSTSTTVSEDHIIGNPSYQVNADEIVNKIIVKYDYDWGQEQFNTVKEYTDSTSITNYGTKEPLTIEMKGITTTKQEEFNGRSKANKLLGRLSTPKAEIGIKTLFNKFEVLPGDQIFLINRFLPQPGTGDDFEYMLEVLSRSPKGFKSNPTIDFKLAFTSYANTRAGLISSSPLISAVTSQKVFTVPDGTLFEEDWYIRLFNDTTGDFYADAANKITDVTGNIITVENNFSTTLTTSVRITSPEYADCSSDQQLRFAFASPNTDVFADTKNAYGILP